MINFLNASNDQLILEYCSICEAVLEVVCFVYNICQGYITLIIAHGSPFIENYAIIIPVECAVF